MKTKQAIPFVTIQDGVGSLFKMNKKLDGVFQQYRNCKVSIVSICGPQRTGKSFLANRLLNQMKGFAIGPSINPCTKGIWIWSQPIILTENHVLLILDTEGLNSVQRDSTIDNKIFTLSILLSSQFVYNSIGHIDQRALQNLNLVVNLSQSIELKAGKRSSDKKLSQNFPKFVWVLRDFSLDLKNKSPNGYLQEELTQHGDFRQERNIIRTKIKTFFKDRQCICMPRPIYDQKTLSLIQQQPYQALNSNFRAQTQRMVRIVRDQSEPKKINGKILTVEGFFYLANEYILSINKGGVPQIQTSLQRVINNSMRKLTDQTKKLFKLKVKQNLFEQKFPLGGNQLQNILNLIKLQSLKSFDTMFYNFIDSQKIPLIRKQFQQLIQTHNQQVKKKNITISQSRAVQQMQRLINNFNPIKPLTIDKFNRQFFKTCYQELLQSIKLYVSQTKQPFRYKTFSQLFPPFIFQFFRDISQNIKRICQQQIGKLRYLLKQMNSNQQRISRALKQNQQSIKKLIKQKHDIQIKYDDLNRQRQYSSNIKVPIQSQKLYIKQNNYKLKIQQLQDTIYKLNMEIKSKAITQQQHSNQQIQFNLSGTTQICDSIKQKLKHTQTQYSQFLQQLSKIRSSANTLSIQTQLNNYQTKYQQKLQKQKKFCQTKIKTNQLLLDSLKTQNHDLIRRIQVYQGKKGNIKDFQSQIQQLSSNLKKKQSSLQTARLLNKQLRQSNKQLKDYVYDIEQKQAQLNAQRVEFISFKSSFPFIMGQSIKAINGKSNKLVKALDAIGGDYAQVILKCVKDYSK